MHAGHDLEFVPAHRKINRFADHDHAEHAVGGRAHLRHRNDAVRKFQSQKRQHHHEGETHQGAGLNEFLPHHFERAQERRFFTRAGQNGVGPAAAHQDVTDVKDAGRKDPRRRIKRLHVRHGKGAAGVAAHIHADKVAPITVFRTPGEQHGVNKEQQVRGKPEESNEQHFAFDFDAVQITGDDAGKRHIQYEPADRMKGFRLQNSEAAQNPPQHNENNK